MYKRTCVLNIIRWSDFSDEMLLYHCWILGSIWESFVLLNVVDIYPVVSRVQVER